MILYRGKMNHKIVLKHMKIQQVFRLEQEAIFSDFIQSNTGVHRKRPAPSLI